MKKMSVKHWRTVVWVVGLIPALAMAAAEPEDLIKYRQNVMKASGGHMAASGAIIKGKVPFKGDLVIHARALEQLNHNIPALFPTGSDFGKTRALDAVWEKRADFEKAARDATSKAKSFARAAAGKDPKAAATAFKALGESCSSCHKKFRKKDK